MGLEGRRLSFDNAMGRSLAAAVNERNGPSFGLATSGAVVVDQGFAPDPVALGKPANSLLSVLPVTQWPTDQFAYLRQTVRDTKADIVPEGDVKPTSQYTVERVPDELDVVAHLSEGVPRFWFQDNPSLLQF